MYLQQAVRYTGRLSIVSWCKDASITFEDAIDTIVSMQHSDYDINLSSV